MAEKKVNPRVVWTGSIMLALLFAGLGFILLFNPLQTPDKQPSAHQLADYAKMGLGVIFLLGAVLLLVPRVAWIAALLLAVVLIGVIGVSLVQGDLSQTIFPALFVVSLGALAYIRRPGGVFTTPPTLNAPPPAGPTPGGPQS